MQHYFRYGFRRISVCAFATLSTSIVGCAVSADDQSHSAAPDVNALESPVVACPGLGGADPMVDGLRLTLDNGDPVPSTSLITTRLWAAAYTSATIAIFDGNSWVARIASPLPHVDAPTITNTTYDVFAYWNGSAVGLELVPWPSVLATQDGVQVKSGDPTHRYLGAVATFTIAAFFDALRARLVWNRYNQVPREIAISATGSWNYNNANSVWREAGGDISNQVEVLAGSMGGSTTNSGGTYVSAQAHALGYPLNASTGYVGTGIGIDSSTVNSAQVGDLGLCTNAPWYGLVTASYEGYLTAGRHSIRWLEIGWGAFNYFFFGNITTPPFGKYGMSGFVTM